MTQKEKIQWVGEEYVSCPDCEKPFNKEPFAKTEITQDLQCPKCFEIFRVEVEE